jgi:hypothetical protein
MKALSEDGSSFQTIVIILTTGDKGKVLVNVVILNVVTSHRTARSVKAVCHVELVRYFSIFGNTNIVKNHIRRSKILYQGSQSPPLAKFI